MFWRFNLNLLECKYIVSEMMNRKMIVLISTYWNVNERMSAYLNTMAKVLISTYWNVN